MVVSSGAIYISVFAIPVFSPCDTFIFRSYSTCNLEISVFFRHDSRENIKIQTFVSAVPACHIS